MVRKELWPKSQHFFDGGPGVRSVRNYLWSERNQGLWRRRRQCINIGSQQAVAHTAAVHTRRALTRQCESKLKMERSDPPSAAGTLDAAVPNSHVQCTHACMMRD